MDPVDVFAKSFTSCVLEIAQDEVDKDQNSISARAESTRSLPAPSPVVDLNALDATTEDLHEAACDQALALRLMLDNAVDDSAESIGSTYGSARGGALQSALDDTVRTLMDAIIDG